MPLARPKKKAKKKAAAKKQSRTKRPPKQHAELAEVVKDRPGMTAAEYALQYEINAADVFKLRSFVFEYLKDFDELRACVRMGFNLDDCPRLGRAFVNNTYVQLRLHEVITQQEFTSVVSGTQIVAKLWQEANKPDKYASSNSSTRIAALKELAKIMQLHRPAEVSQVADSGVMLIPAEVPPDSWEANAREQQRALKQQAAIDVESVPIP